MTIKLEKLWVLCTYVGRVEIFDDNGLDIEIESLSNLILKDDDPYHKLAKREVQFFDFIALPYPHEKMMIKLK